MFPAGGNAGWIDEAMASWRDNGYPKKTGGIRETRMAGHSIYRRHTDRNAYTLGARFIAYLDHKFADQGGMKKFKKELASKLMYQPMTTARFQKLLESFFVTNLSDLFDRYIYGVDRFQGAYITIPIILENEIEKNRRENRFHRRHTEAQMMSFM